MKINVTLESTLQQHVEIFTNIVKNYNLNEFEQGIFIELKEKHQAGYNVSDSMIDSIQLFDIENNNFTKEKKDGNFLSTLELINAKKTGIYGPKKLEISESLKQDVLRCNDLLNEELMSNLVPAWHAHLWCPSFIKLIESNYDQLLHVTQSIFGDDNNFYMNTGIYVVRPGENGLRILHKDYAPINTINIYISLSDIDENSSPLVLFPGTYKETGGHHTYIQYLLDKGLEEEFNLIIKSLAISQSAMMTKKIQYFYDGIIPNTVLHLLATYKQALNNNACFNRIHGEIFKQKAGEFIVFPSNIWHQSVSPMQRNKNSNTESRIVFTIRILRDIDFCNNLGMSFRNSFNRHLIIIANYFELELNNLKEILLDSCDESLIKMSVLLNKDCDEKSSITLQRLSWFHNNMKLKSKIKKKIPEITKCLISPARGSKNFVINNTSAHQNILILGYDKLKGDSIKIEGFSSQPNLKKERFLGIDNSVKVSFLCSNNKIYIYNCNDGIDIKV